MPETSITRNVCVGIAFLAFSIPALPDQIVPTSFATSLRVGESVTVTKTVTSVQFAAIPLDVFFLLDTTGSMRTQLDGLKDDFARMISEISGMGSNVFFGVGNYKDCVWGPGDCPSGTLDLAYTLTQDLTSDLDAVRSALDGLSASGGGDPFEANLYALKQVADTTSWRDSRRFLIWAGDDPGYDPRQGVTLEAARNALQDARLHSVALDVGGGLGDFLEQASYLSEYFLDASDSDPYTQGILNDLIDRYVLTMDAVGLGPGLDVAFTPKEFWGSSGRGPNGEFAFDVTYTGVTPGTYSFELVTKLDNADKAMVAREINTITVGGVPEPATYALCGSALALLALLRRLV